MKVIKIGGSFITDKSSYQKANTGNMDKIAKAISEIYQNDEEIVLVHGAGSFGHNLVKEYGIEDGVKNDEQKLGCAKTHLSCMELTAKFMKVLIDNGIPAMPIDTSSVITQKNKRIDSFDQDIIHDYLEKGFVPVLRGDMVVDKECGGSVCSGDQIVARLGQEAENIVFITDVDGVLDGDGKLIPEITKGNFEEISKYLKPKKNDVTGAMKGKISEMLSLDTTSYIVNGNEPQRLIDVIVGKDTICTRIIPKK